MSELTESQAKAAELLSCKVFTNQTDQQIADEVGVSRQTLFKWRQKPEFISVLRELNDKDFNELVPLAYAAVEKGLTDPNTPPTVKARLSELVLRATGKLNVIEGSSNSPVESNAADILESLGISSKGE